MEPGADRLKDLSKVTRLVGEVLELEMTEPDVRAHAPTPGPPAPPISAGGLRSACQGGSHVRWAWVLVPGL